MLLLTVKSSKFAMTGASQSKIATTLWKSLTMPGEIGSEQVIQLAAELGMNSSYLIEIAGSMYKRLLPLMNKALEELMPTFGPSEIPQAKRISLKVTTNAQSFNQWMG